LPAITSGAAHDAGERQRLRVVRDDEQIRRERDLLIV
jgi:hypothetical protein